MSRAAKAAPVLRYAPRLPSRPKRRGAPLKAAAAALLLCTGCAAQVGASRFALGDSSVCDREIVAEGLTVRENCVRGGKLSDAFVGLGSAVLGYLSAGMF